MLVIPNQAVTTMIARSTLLNEVGLKPKVLDELCSHLEGSELHTVTVTELTLSGVLFARRALEKLVNLTGEPMLLRHHLLRNSPADTPGMEPQLIWILDV